MWTIRTRPSSSGTPATTGNALCAKIERVRWFHIMPLSNIIPILVLQGRLPPRSKAHGRKAIHQIEVPAFGYGGDTSMLLLQLEPFRLFCRPHTWLCGDDQCCVGQMLGEHKTCGWLWEVGCGRPWPGEPVRRSLISWELGRPGRWKGLCGKGAAHQSGSLCISSIRTRGEVRPGRPSILASVRSLSLDGSDPSLCSG